MSNIVDLQAERDKRDPPAASTVTTDTEGRAMFKYSISYRVDGREFSTSFFAYDLDDAYHRCNCMVATLQLDGQLYEENA